MIKAIFLDLDNTLVVNQMFYDRAEAMLAGYLGHFGVRADEVDEVFAKIDRGLFATHGYNRSRLPQAFEDTLKHFAPNADDEMIATVRGYAEKVFNTVAWPMPNVEEALELLAGIAPLYIVTAGPQDVQQFRIDHLPFKDKFAGFYMVDKKDAALFDKICKEVGIAPQEGVMIGDSLKSDVLAPAAAGLKAVWIEAHNSKHEVVESKALPANAFKFPSLLESARYIAKHGKLPDQPYKPQPPRPRFK